MQLSKQYDYWQGTPYRLGGTSKNGIDCSALIQIIYKNAFTKNIPRTTKIQAQSGAFVTRNNLKIGDLVFFKPSGKSRHVGIYMGKNQFMHASTSKGVIISTLDNPYWKSNYWQARRILDK